MSGAGCRVACAYLPRFRAIAYRTAISYPCTAGRRWRRGPAALLGRFLPRLRAAPSGVAFFVCRARAGRQAVSGGRVKRNWELDCTLSRHETPPHHPRNHGHCCLGAGRGGSKLSCEHRYGAGRAVRDGRTFDQSGSLDRSPAAQRGLRDDGNPGPRPAEAPRGCRDPAGSRDGPRRAAAPGRGHPPREGIAARPVAGRASAPCRSRPHRRDGSGGPAPP